MSAEVIQEARINDIQPRPKPTTRCRRSAQTERVLVTALILALGGCGASDSPGPAPDRMGGAGGSAGSGGAPRAAGGNGGSVAPTAGTGGGGGSLAGAGGAAGMAMPPGMGGMGGEGGAMDAGMDAPVIDPSMGDAGTDSADAADTNSVPAVDMAPPKPGCGNGVLEAGEKCDQGAANSKDAYGKGKCTDKCDEAPYCGDTRIDTLQQEECDQGSANAKDATGPGKCTDLCKNAPFCGDRKVQMALQEECDEGPMGLEPKPGVAGCSAQCKARPALPVDPNQCGTDPACGSDQKCVDGVCVAKKIESLVVHDTDNASGWKIETAPFQIGIMGARPWSDPEWQGTYVASLDATAAATLLGHEWISVTTESKEFAGPDLATLTLRAAADLYMFVDDRWIMPPWVAGWEDTGMKAVVFESAGRPMLSFSIRVKKAQTGAVKLPAIAGTTAYNYFIVAR